MRNDRNHFRHLLCSGWSLFLICWPMRCGSKHAHKEMTRGACTSDWAERFAASSQISCFCLFIERELLFSKSRAATKCVFHKLVGVAVINVYSERLLELLLHVRNTEYEYLGVMSQRDTFICAGNNRGNILYRSLSHESIKEHGQFHTRLTLIFLKTCLPVLSRSNLATRSKQTIRRQM
jgi:hypothetical protein